MAKKKTKNSETLGKVNEKNFDFEESLGEVEGIVSQLESGELGLTASLQKYEQGIRELKQCQSLLDAAEQKISQLSGFDADGNAVTSSPPLDSTPAKRSKTGNRPKNAAKSGNDPETLNDTIASDSSVDDSPGLF
ncbi:exodeoxyribonuclease VII small subunit [bacterium]|nr:exodeoxyribonuclease VII small subunit [bacterium]MDB4500443.1 exodeoxyribonuclease VII small subunit [bacterium]